MSNWLMQVLASEMSPKKVPSSATFFLIKMQQVKGLMSSEANEYWSMTIVYSYKGKLQESTIFLKKTY